MGTNLLTLHSCYICGLPIGTTKLFQVEYNKVLKLQLLFYQNYGVSISYNVVVYKWRLLAL